MYRNLLISAMFVVGVPILSLAYEPDSGEIPPDYGPFSPPPAPPAGEPASGWIFLSHPDHFRTPLYYLRDGIRDGPTVSIIMASLKGMSLKRAFDLAPRLNLSIKDAPLDQFVSIASGDIVPIAGRLVRFERAEFPADYPQASIPKHVIDRGLRWTDVTDSVPAELRPDRGWPLLLATSDPEKRSGQHQFSYKLFPDPDLRKAEVNKRPFYVRVAEIMVIAEEAEKSEAEIEIIAWTPLRQQAVRKLSVRVGQSIKHAKRSHRVLKIVPPGNIAGIGKLIGWVEVEL